MKDITLTHNFDFENKIIDFRPCWRPSWILNFPQGWEVPTRAKFQVNTFNYHKMPKNLAIATHQGSRYLPPDYIAFILSHTLTRMITLKVCTHIVKCRLI